VGLGPLGAAAARAAPRPPALPAAILCDATLTLETEADALAAAGMDALVHCLESYLSSAYNPPADGIALDGLRRAARNIEAAVTGTGDRLAPRRELLAAALDAGLAAQKGVGGVEAAARGLETTAATRHGALHAALLRAVLAFNAPAIGDRLADLERALDLPAGADIAAALTGLAARIGLPRRLSEAGIAAAALSAAARRAAADPANRTNPRHATSADYERIMAAAL
jgi:alcohol dehydrogenase class IV